MVLAICLSPQQSLTSSKFVDANLIVWTTCAGGYLAVWAVKMT